MSDSFIYRPPTCPIEIIYQDKDVLVVNKPSGLLSVPGRAPHHQDSLEHRLKEKYSLLRSVHRLDMDTSGIMIFALRKKAEIALKKQFQAKDIEKEYRAVVQGVLTEKEAVIDLSLAPHPTKKLRHWVDPNGKKSITGYRVLREEKDCSLLALFPKTGRSHQIRVHLQAIGHPILGDRFYAPEAVQKRSSRLLLHAYQISFLQPYSGKRLQFSCPQEFDFR